MTVKRRHSRSGSSRAGPLHFSGDGLSATGFWAAWQCLSLRCDQTIKRDFAFRSDPARDVRGDEHRARISTDFHASNTKLRHRCRRRIRAWSRDPRDAAVWNSRFDCQEAWTRRSAMCGVAWGSCLGWQVRASGCSNCRATSLIVSFSMETKALSEQFFGPLFCKVNYRRALSLTTLAGVVGLTIDATCRAHFSSASRFSSSYR